MKKIIIVIVFLLATTITSATAFANSNLNIYINGDQVMYTDQYGHPFIDEQGRTQVPLRKTMESFGCTVSWDNDKYEAVLSTGETIVIVPIGQNHIIVNGYTKQIDTAAQIKDGRTYLPIRSVVEAFNGKVDWDPAKQSVSIVGDKDRGFLIDDVSINNRGELIVTTDSGEVMNLGRVKGKDGDDGSNGSSGTSIRSVRVDANSNLIVTLTNGQTMNAGNVSGSSPYNTFADYEEGTRFYNLYPIGEFDCFVMKGGVKYTVTITESYYELDSINDIEDESSWDFIDHMEGWYEFRPFDIDVVIEGFTDPDLAGHELTLYYGGLGIKGIIQSNGSINIENSISSWKYPDIKFYGFARLTTQHLYNLTDLEDDLNDDYIHIEGLEIHGIELSGDEDELVVIISMNLEGEWDNDYWVNHEYSSSLVP